MLDEASSREVHSTQIGSTNLLGPCGVSQVQAKPPHGITGLWKSLDRTHLWCTAGRKLAPDPPRVHDNQRGPNSDLNPLASKDVHVNDTLYVASKIRGL